MDTFKQFHGDKNIFTRETKIYFGQCDIQNRLSLSQLLLFTSDTAVEDYHQRDMSFEFLKKNGFAILVSRASFKIYRMPFANEYITIRTWEEAPRGVQLLRRYEIVSHDSQKLVSGISTWLVVNPATHRIIKPHDFTLRSEPDFSTDVDCMDCGKITMPENAIHLDTRTIRYSDIDANGHMNNSHYGSFIVDCLPLEYQQKTMTDFRINYAQEAVLGDELELLGCFDDVAKKVVVTGKQRDTICFESELYYQ